MLYGRSTYIEPILRPVSFAATITSLTLTSASGSLDRLSLATNGMPALGGNIPPTGGAEPMDLAVWERDLDRLTATRSSLGTIRFLVDGEEFFDRLEAAIAGASRSVDIRTYIFDNDDYAVGFADRLRQRSHEAIEVRVLIDTLGNMQAQQVDPESLPDDHRPPLSMSTYLKTESRVDVRSYANPWLTGDHVKTTIVDGEIGFVGGMNIGREYRYDWHDLMMEVRGPIVGRLQREMDVAWARAGLLGDLGAALQRAGPANETAATGGYPIRVLETRSLDFDIYQAQLEAIRRSRQYIVIENAYFSDDRTLYELARARRRGVDVRVIIPTEGNHGPLNSSHLVAINQMLEHGIRVYRYPGMSHVKAAIYDGWLCVGSANFDKLSLEVNRELNLATSDPGARDALMRRVFLPDLAISTEVLEPVDVTLGDRITEIIVDEVL